MEPTDILGMIGLVILLVGVTAGAYRLQNPKPASAATPTAAPTGGGSGKVKNLFSGISKLVPGKDAILMIILIAVALVLVWISSETLMEFPEMSQLEKLSTFAIVLFTGIALLGIWTQRKEKSVWPWRFTVFGIVGTLLIGGLTMVYGERFVADPTSQSAFDLRTGEPNYMGFLDSGGVWQRGFGEDGELLLPHNCRPLELVSVLKSVDGAMKRVNQLQPVAHEGFNYSTEGTCHAPSTGAKMVPISAENVPITPSLRPFSTPAERAAEEEVRQTNNDRAAQEEAARELIRLATLRPVIEECTTREFRTYGDCSRITLKQGGETFSRTKSAAENCLVFDDGRRINRDVAGLTVTYSLKPGERQATFHLLELSPGQSYRTYTC